MPTPTSQKSALYGLIQTLLLCAFGAAVFLAPRVPLLLPGEAPRIIGGGFCVAGLVFSSRELPVSAVPSR